MQMDPLESASSLQQESRWHFKQFAETTELKQTVGKMQMHSN